MSNNHLFKNIIIGSGAGGSIVANEIIKSGNDTLLIEEGGKYDLSYFKKNSLSRRAIDLWRNGGITPLIGKPPIAYVEGVAFGGTTVTNGGVIQRPSHELIDSWANKFEISNFNYRDLIKHFNYIEKKLNVISVEDYSSNDDSNILVNTLKKNNISYRQARLAHKNCVNSNQCISGCPTGAKQSNLSFNYLPEAIEKGLKIKLNNKVLKIKKDNQKFKIETNKSNFFCENLYVCAGATQSAYLLRKHKLSMK